jgi:beta-hydroxylase
MLSLHVLVPELCVVGMFVGAGAYVHFRGKVRHKLRRQITDHSTFMAPYNALIYLFSGVPNTPVQKIEDFPELKPLRDNWQMIRDEAMRLDEDGHIRKSEKHNDIAFGSFFRRGWKRFYLKWYDDFLPSARELCPRTVEMVRAIPSVNAAMFALLPPRSKLGEHRDPFAGSLRYHLGLMTPNSDDCRIFIDGEPHAWRDGQDILFDETYIHSVRNDTDLPRLILFCDVARPIRNPLVRALNRFITRYVVRVTAAHNVPTEKIGLVNRLVAPVFYIRDLGQRLKKVNRTAYHVINYAILAGILLLLALPLVWPALVRRHRH